MAIKKAPFKFKGVHFGTVSYNDPLRHDEGSYQSMWDTFEEAKHDALESPDSSGTFIAVYSLDRVIYLERSKIKELEAENGDQKTT
jgi:hypothetical protein